MAKGKAERGPKLQVWLESEAQRDDFERAATAKGLTLSALVRMLLVDEVRRQQRGGKRPG